MSEWMQSICTWALIIGVYCLCLLPCVAAGLVLGAVAAIVLRDACCRRVRTHRTPTTPSPSP